MAIPLKPALSLLREVSCSDTILNGHAPNISPARPRPPGSDHVQELRRRTHGHDPPNRRCGVYDRHGRCRRRTTASRVIRLPLSRAYEVEVVLPAHPPPNG